MIKILQSFSEKVWFNSLVFACDSACVGGAGLQTCLYVNIYDYGSQFYFPVLLLHFWIGMLYNDSADTC